MYLLPYTFFTRYPLGRQIASGKEIYESGPYVVKYEMNDNNAIPEINYYSMIDHPNVVKLIDWTYISNNNEGDVGMYFAFRRGIPIVEAIQNGMISLDDVIRDLISTVAFLNSNQIAHRDIKSENIIYDNGLKLIDFGLAITAVPFKDPEGHEKDYIIGLGYTEMFRDPEYVPTEYNPISSELYAIGQTIYFLVERLKGHSATKIYDIMNKSYYPITNTQYDDLINLCRYFPIKDRVSILYVNSQYGKPLTGTLLQTPVVPLDPRCGKTIIGLEISILELAVWLNFSAQSLFLSIHLFRRVAPRIYSSYSSEHWASLLLTGVICLYLVSTVFQPYSLTFDDCKEILDRDSISIDKEVFMQFLTRVLIESQNIIITPTYWDYARYSEDLPVLLADTISCSYNPQIIRPLTRKSGSSKYVSAKYLFESPLIRQQIDLYEIQEGFKSLPSTRGGVPQIKPSEQIPVYQTKEDFIDVAPRKASDLRMIAHFWEWLPDLPQEDAINIYNRMKSTRMGKEILTKLVKFNISTSAVALGIQPFRATLEDVKEAQKARLRRTNILLD